jgi:hypothetical protein
LSRHWMKPRFQGSPAQIYFSRSTLRDSRGGFTETPSALNPHQERLAARACPLTVACLSDSIPQTIRFDTFCASHLPKDVPVKAFLSVIVCDNQTRSKMQTDQQPPSVSSQITQSQLTPDWELPCGRTRRAMARFRADGRLLSLQGGRRHRLRQWGDNLLA